MTAISIPRPLRFALAVVATTSVAGCGWAEWPPPSWRERSPYDAPDPRSPREATSAPTQIASLPPKPLPPIAREERAVPLPAPPDHVIVGPGDTVYALSRRYAVPVRTIIDANGLQPPYRLVVGQRITLPQQREHVVREGETLYSVAERYGVGIHAVASLNGLVAPYRIRVGQRLHIPAA